MGAGMIHELIEIFANAMVLVSFVQIKRAIWAR